MTMFKAMSVFFISVMMALAQEGRSYWEMDVPVMDRAQDVLRERNVDFFSSKTVYAVEIDSVNELFDFYRHFFVKLGWKESFETGGGSSIQNQRGWASCTLRHNKQGLPELEYSNMWEAKTMPATAVVRLTVCDVNIERLVSKVVVGISPDVDTSAFGELNDLVFNDPRKLFILNKASEGNPWEIETVRRHPKKGYEHYEIVKQYYAIYGDILVKCRQFGKKYLGVDSEGVLLRTGQDKRPTLVSESRRKVRSDGEQ